MFAELVNQASLVANFIKTEYNKPTVIVEEAGSITNKFRKMSPRVTIPEDAEYDDVAFFPCENDDEVKDLLKKMSSAGIPAYAISSKTEVITQEDE